MSQQRPGPAAARISDAERSAFAVASHSRSIASAAVMPP